MNNLLYDDGTTIIIETHEMEIAVQSKRIISFRD